jgi:hypothetical protein
MKKFIILSLNMLCVFGLSAQTSQKSTTPSLAPYIQKVMDDLPRQLQGITGAHIMTMGEIDQYESKLVPPGSVSTMILRYHSRKELTPSWQVCLYEGDDFQIASKKYKDAYQQALNSRISLPEVGTVSLKGEYVTPREEMKFATSVLRAATDHPYYSNYKVQVELVLQVIEWKVLVSVFKQEDVQEIRPTLHDSDSR